MQMLMKIECVGFHLHSNNFLSLTACSLRHLCPHDSHICSPHRDPVLSLLDWFRTFSAYTSPLRHRIGRNPRVDVGSDHFPRGEMGLQHAPTKRSR
jgi:hypothetical protein